MHVSTIITSCSALIAGVQAGGPSSRDDPHIADFRLWGSETCSGDLNYGVWTILQSDTDKCFSFLANNPNAPVFTGIGLANISDGYNLLLFTDDECNEGSTQATVGGCEAGQPEWKSFIVKK